MDKMDFSPTTDEIWKALDKTVEKYGGKDVLLNSDAKTRFYKTFENLYYEIKDRYMRRSVNTLDAHKVCAAMITAALQENVIVKGPLSHYGIFLGAELVVAEVGLAWMRDRFNEKLSAHKIEPIKHYEMPVAFACETPYFEIFCRNLYYAQRDGYKLNPMDIAEKLFLIEYITAIEKNIPWEYLKD